MEICSDCHPFFTGKQKLVDTAGRVERFRRRYAKIDAKKKAETEGAAKQAAEAEPTGSTESAPPDASSDEAKST